MPLTNNHHARAKRAPDGRRAGFTLIEFILVMALLASVMALAAPSLSRFFRQRNLTQEAARLVAVIEYGRSEAVSQGFPMQIWIDPTRQRYGLEPRSGYPVNPGRRREYPLHPEVRLEVTRTGSGAARVSELERIEFGPDGTLAGTSPAALTLVDRQGAELVVAQTTNGWSFEVLRAQDYAMRPVIR